MVIERSLIIIKHDGVVRGLIGECIKRFENTGLKIVGMKMVWADEKKTDAHYPLDEEWAKGLYAKTKAAYDKEDKKMQYKNHIELGKSIQDRLKKFIVEGPIVAMVLEGPHAVELGRKLVGHTEPRQALPGTIRGDLASIESYPLADGKSRVLRNLIHASDTTENAKREISIWFTEKEIYSYKKELDKHF